MLGVFFKLFKGNINNNNNINNIKSQIISSDGH